MPSQSDKVSFRGRLATRASVVPETWNDEAGTVDIVWTTGARGLRSPWFGEPFYEELEVTRTAVDLSRLNNGAPFLNAHNGYELGAVVGVVERAWIEDGKGMATVRFSDRADVQPIRQDVKAGILRHISVGYDPKKYKDVGEQDGKRILRAVQWLPMELSLVPMGFDDGAVTRARNDGDAVYEVPITRGSGPQENAAMANVDPNQGGSPAPATASAPPAPSAPAPVVVNVLPPSGEATRSAPPVQGTSSASLTADQIREAGLAAVKADRERSADIVRRATAVGLVEFGRQLADSGIGVDDAKDKILEELARRQGAQPSNIPSGGGVQITDDNRDRWMAGAQSRIIERAGLVELMAKHAAKRGETYKPDAAEFRSMRMYDLAKDSLARSGLSDSRIRRMSDRELVGQAFTRAMGDQTTSEFSTLLENTMHKVLMAAYDLAEVTWPRFCKVGSVTDLRAHPMYQKGSLGRLQKVNEGGEIENLKAGDGRKESVQAYTYAGMVSLSREAIINDDLGVFSDMGTDAGEAAAYTVELLVYDLLADNSGLGSNLSDGLPLFDATRTVVDSTGTSRSLSNVGTDSTIGVAAIEADRVQMALIRDVTGNRVIGLRPSVLLLPVGLEGTAKVINQSTWDVDAVGTALPNMFQVPNKVVGLFHDIVGSPHLSGTRRYQFADPARYPSIMVAYLNGQSSPVIETREGWRTTGVEWRILLDAAVAGVNHRNCLTNDGTP